jgi:hypothetical protein
MIDDHAGCDSHVSYLDVKDIGNGAEFRGTGGVGRGQRSELCLVRLCKLNIATAKLGHLFGIHTLVLTKRLRVSCKGWRKHLAGAGKGGRSELGPGHREESG